MFNAEFFGGQHIKNVYKCKVLTLAEHQSFDIRQLKEHFNSFLVFHKLHKFTATMKVTFEFNVNISDYLLREKPNEKKRKIEFIFGD